MCCGCRSDYHTDLDYKSDHHTIIGVLMLMMGLSIIGVLMLMMGVPRRSARQGGGVSRSVGPPVAVCGGALACRGPCALHPCGAVLRGWRRGGGGTSRQPFPPQLVNVTATGQSSTGQSTFGQFKITDQPTTGRYPITGQSTAGQCSATGLFLISRDRSVANRASAASSAREPNRHRYRPRPAPRIPAAGAAPLGRPTRARRS